MENYAGDTEYWAAQGREDLGGELESRAKAWARYLERRGIARTIKSSRRLWMGRDPEGGTPSATRLTDGGEEGELLLMQAPIYRATGEAILAMTTGQPPAYEATARDASALSMSACKLAESIWEYELERKIDDLAIEATERMLVDGEACWFVGWDHTKGDAVAVHEQGPVAMESEANGAGPYREAPQLEHRPPRIEYAGDLDIEIMSLQDVIRDPDYREISDLPWVIIRRRMSRWDLVALYPSEEDHQHILAAPGARSDESGYFSAYSLDTKDDVTRNDVVTVLEFYHRRTPAVPEGRFARVVHGHVLEMGELQYEDLPVVMASAATESDEAVGWSRHWTVLGLSQALDASLSNMVSVDQTWGSPNILAPKGAEMTVEKLAGGQKLIEYLPQQHIPPPGPMQHPEVSQNALAYTETLKSLIQQSTGANDVVMGDPAESLKSGRALAVVQAMAVQATNRFQGAYARMMRRVATLIIKAYQGHAKGEHIIEVTGTQERRTVQQFTGGDLEGVVRIRAELANPLMRTMAGKQEIATVLLDQQMFPLDAPLTREAYIGFLSTGRLESLAPGKGAEVLGIEEENEMLLRGDQPEALFLDNHEWHINAHSRLLHGRQRIGLNEQQLQAVMMHIEEHHLMLLQDGPPGGEAPTPGMEDGNGGGIPGGVGEGAQEMPGLGAPANPAAAQAEGIIEDADAAATATSPRDTGP